MFKSRLSVFTDRKYDVLLIGEILVDEIRDDNGVLFLTFGGSPSNIALNLKQLGLNPQLVATLGNDAEGSFLQNTLNKYHLSTDMIRKVALPTSRVQLSDSKETPVPTFKRLSDFYIDYSDRLDDVIKNSKILHLSYWPLTKEPSKSTVLKAMKRAKQENVLIAFDPNIHQDLRTEDTISHEELLSLLRNIDIIKPSLDDAARLFGEGYTKEQYMDFFEAAGIPLILMSLGKDGVFVSYKGKRSTYKANKIDVLDATGAGDAFWSGFYSGLLNELSIAETIECAQAISAIVLKSIGAITELPDFKDIYQRRQYYANTFPEPSR